MMKNSSGSPFDYCKSPDCLDESPGKGRDPPCSPDSYPRSASSSSSCLLGPSKRGPHNSSSSGGVVVVSSESCCIPPSESGVVSGVVSSGPGSISGGGVCCSSSLYGGSVSRSPTLFAPSGKGTRLLRSSVANLLENKSLVLDDHWERGEELFCPSRELSEEEKGVGDNRIQDHWSGLKMTTGSEDEITPEFAPPDDVENGPARKVSWGMNTSCRRGQRSKHPPPSSSCSSVMGLSSPCANGLPPLRRRTFGVFKDRLRGPALPIRGGSHHNAGPPLLWRRNAEMVRNQLRRHVIIEVSEGRHTIHEWQVAQLLEEIYKHAPLPCMKPLRSHQTSILTYRDCRQVFTDVIHPVPSIEVRRHCIVICLPPVTCFLLHDRVFLLVVEELRADGIIRQLVDISASHYHPIKLSQQNYWSNHPQQDGTSSPHDNHLLQKIPKSIRGEPFHNKNYITQKTLKRNKKNRIRRTNTREEQLVRVENLTGQELHRTSSPKMASSLESTNHTPPPSSKDDNRHLQDDMKKKSQNGSILVSNFPTDQRLDRITSGDPTGNDRADHSQLHIGTTTTAHTISKCTPTIDKNNTKNNMKNSTKINTITTTPTPIVVARGRFEAYPFEYACLECLISASFHHLHSDISRIEATLSQINIKVKRKLSPSSILLEDLHSVKEPVVIYEDKVKAFDKVFNELLGNASDLSRMALTRYYYNDGLYDSAYLTPQVLSGAVIEVSDPDLEILLEYFDQEMDQFLERVRHMRELVGNTERLISLRLALVRNKLIYLELAATIIATGIAVGTCLSGIFGMNMKSGFEDSHQAFLVTTACVSAISVVSLIVVTYVFYAIRL